MTRRRSEAIAGYRERSTTQSGAHRASSHTDIRHHVLDAGVVLEAVHGQVLAVAGVLEATMRHLSDDRDVGVDPHAAEVEAARHPHGPPVVLGEDRGGQAV